MCILQLLIAVAALSQQDTLDNWGYDVSDLYGQSAFALVFIKVVCPPAPQPKDTTVKLVGQANLKINLTLPIAVGTQPYYLEVGRVGGYS